MLNHQTLSCRNTFHMHLEMIKMKYVHPGMPLNTVDGGTCVLLVQMHPLKNIW